MIKSVESIIRRDLRTKKLTWTENNFLLKTPLSKKQVILLLILWMCVRNASAQDFLASTLPSSKGFQIIGAASTDLSGYAVSDLGDVNGDNIDDLIVGAYNADPTSGADAGISYVIFGVDVAGGATAYTNVLLTTGATALSPSIGFRILGATGSDISGRSVRGAGDINKDGINDILVGAQNVASMTGIAYVIFGRNVPGGATAFGDIQLTTGATALAAGVGFRILGVAGMDRFGSSVSSAGDVNHDGVDDIIVGAYSAAARKGISYVIYGRNIPGGATAFTDIQLTSSALSTSVGFRILGATASDESGISVSGAGDVNADGVDDIIVGADGVTTSGGTLAGVTYVIFGRNIPGGAAAFGDIQLTPIATPLVASVGFRLLGAAATDLSGSTVAAAGDINKDGIGDILVGAYAADPPNGVGGGISYVIFGRNIAGGAAAFGDIQLTTGTTTMSANIGFRILGAAGNDASGRSLKAVGDVNGDGVDDIIVGAYNADTPSANGGMAYVIYGRNIAAGATAFADIQLTSGSIAMAVSTGFRIVGVSTNAYCGFAVSSAGDVNNDGIADILVGSYGVGTSAGITYVVYGRPPAPTSQPSSQPSRQPSRQPSNQPTRQPSSQPSRQPSRQPTSQPSCQPSTQPVARPSTQPSQQPSSQPSVQPTWQPTQPSSQPTRQPSSQPTAQPSRLPSQQPSAQPSRKPSVQPTAQPTSQPTRQPSSQPSKQPTAQPTMQPNAQPSAQPSLQPVGRPSSQPSSQPSRQPSGQPSMQPSSQPTLQPSSQPGACPTTQPSMQPSRQPSRQPTVQPSRQPTHQPSKQPSSQPSGQPSAQPSAQPSNQPSNQPSQQPSRQPSAQPSAQPSQQPSMQPTRQPSGQPSVQPSVQPSAQPSGQPSGQPSHQPTAHPSRQPSAQPSMQPSVRPFCRPTSQPSAQPSRQPTAQPLGQPTRQPSQQPTVQPSRQPSILPSGQPSNQPSLHPSRQPSRQPSNQPSTQPSSPPSSQPSIQPSQQPSRQPSRQPSAQPSNQPSLQPSRQPSVQSSGQPSAQLSTQPSAQPSRQPSSQPSSQPSHKPTLQPTIQPTKRPGAQPTSQPTIQPSIQPLALPSTAPSSAPSSAPSTQPTQQPTSYPSMQPSARPSCQPTAQPSSQPAHPSSHPTGAPTQKSKPQPTSVPSAQPTTLPSSQPATQPTSQPTTQPSMQPTCNPIDFLSTSPSSQPSGKPTAQPTTPPSSKPVSAPSSQPSLQPSTQPSTQLTNQPSAQPFASPSSQPSSQPSAGPWQLPPMQPSVQPSSPLANGEWVTIVENAASLKQLTSPENALWVCGEYLLHNEGPFCAQIDATFGVEFARYLLPWDEITSIILAEDASRNVIIGRTVDETMVVSSIAVCALVDLQLICQSKTFPDTNLEVASYIPYVKQTVHIGTFRDQLFVSIMDSTGGTFRSHIYSGSTNAMKKIEITQAQSPPGFVGTFVAGTCVSTASVNYIYAGVIRADSGIMTAMYVLPTRGSILNRAELVNTMALENTRPDSFIAGGIQLSDSTSMHAYLLCVNSLFNSVEYGMRYKAVSVTGLSGRRSLLEQISLNSAVKGVVLVNAVLFMIVDVMGATDGSTPDRVCIAKVDIGTGLIIHQLQIESQSAGLSCSRIATSTTFLYITCTAVYFNQTRQQVVLSVNQDLGLSKLPVGFRRYQNETLQAEKVAFKRVFLPLSVRSAAIDTVESEFIVENRSPAISALPSSFPSSQPTSAPSVSPQPTSQPSTSGPTNTYKPTVKPTQHPSVKPACTPTAKPSRRPTRVPTKRPTPQPSIKSSTSPSVAQTKAPTRASSRIPTKVVTSTASGIPTEAPSISADASNPATTALATTIMSYCVGALVGLWLLYQLRNWCSRKIDILKGDKQFMLQMEALKLPVHSRYPIFSALMALFCVIVPSDYKEPGIIELEIEEEEEEMGAQTAPNNHAIEVLAEIATVSPEQEPIRRGAYMNGPNFVDSEDDEINTLVKDIGMDGKSRSVPQKTRLTPSSETRVLPANLKQTISGEHIILGERESVSPTRTESAASFYQSDDSSYLSDIVNAMMMEDSVNSSINDSAEDDNYSVSTVSGDSEDSV